MAEKTVGEHVETIERHALNTLAVFPDQVDASDKLFLATLIQLLVGALGKKGSELLQQPLSSGIGKRPKVS